MPGNIAVIGAGVVGLACASELQRRGHAVTLIDPGLPGQGCSFGNAGCLSRASCVPLGLPGSWRKVPGWLLDPAGPLSIRLRYAHRIAPWLWRLHLSTSLARVNQIADALRPLLDRSIEKWRPLAAWAGVPELIRQDGYAFSYESEAGFAGDALGRSLRVARDVEITVLQGPEIREFDPALSPTITHLVLMPQQGHVANPGRLSRALAERLRSGGATFVSAAAKGFDFRDDRVARVITDGPSVEVGAVVIAAGAYSKQFAEKLDSDVPLETERGYHVMLESPSVLPRIPVCSGEGKYFMTPMETGLRIAGTVELAGLEAPPNYRRADFLLPGAKRLLPGLKHGKVERWMGHRPSLPDSMPVLGRSPRVPNAYFAFGHGHVGLTAASPTAGIIADLVENRDPYMDIHPFAAERF
ncbi:MAG: FAD-binding oxidoreductase [Betaproteobacteria bacterium]|nr:MAG: FAD-binding oxidoreductase [Betaproteobacteria bacterium]